MQKYLIKNIQVVNEGHIKTADVLITNGRIEKIAANIDTVANEINGEGKYLFPGCIDDQVHFREPGLTHKATIYTCLLYTSPSPRDRTRSRMPSSA